MADSLRSRVSQVIVGSVHALVNQVEGQSPEPMMEQAFRKIDSMNDEIREELGVITVNLHLTQRHHMELQRRHHQLSVNAEEAIAQQRDDVAREAVIKQLVIEGRMLVIERSLIALKNQEKELAGYIDALTTKRREIEQLLANYRHSHNSANAAAGQSASSSPG